MLRRLSGISTLIRGGIILPLCDVIPSQVPLLQNG